MGMGILPTDQWKHLAVTFDGFVFNFYVDGVLKGGPIFRTFQSPNNAALLIGGSGGCSTFIGLIDEVRIYNRALSGDEIKAIYDSGSAGEIKTSGPMPTASATPSPTGTPTLIPPPTPTFVPTGGLTRGGTISGTVTDDETGRPISAVNIVADKLDSISPRYNGLSDRSGRYILIGVAPGRYRLWPTVGRGDYIPEIYDDRLNFNDADVVTVRGAEAVEGIDFALRPGARISGTVTDDLTGLPLSNITVTAGPSMVHTKTDGLGRYTLRGLPDGVIEVEMSGQGSEYVEATRGVSVSGEGHYADIDFSLVTGTTISGRVTDEDTGLPISNQRIDINNVLGGIAPRAESVTGDDGRYTLRGVAPGIYRVFPCCAGLDYVREYYDDKLTPGGADLITITAKEPIEGIDFALKRGATISGRVRDGQTGLPISSMRVQAGQAAWPYISETYTDGLGEYTLRGVPNGAIVLVVDGQGYLEQRKSITVTDGEDVTGVDF